MGLHFLLNFRMISRDEEQEWDQIIQLIFLK